MRSIIAGVTSGLTVGLTVVVLAMGGQSQAGQDNGPDCFEDQVAVWHNGSHSKCVDVDDPRLVDTIRQTSKGE